MLPERRLGLGVTVVSAENLLCRCFRRTSGQKDPISRREVSLIENSAPNICSRPHAAPLSSAAGSRLSMADTEQPGRTSAGPQGEGVLLVDRKLKRSEKWSSSGSAESRSRAVGEEGPRERGDRSYIGSHTRNTAAAAQHSRAEEQQLCRYAAVFPPTEGVAFLLLS